MMAEEAPSRYPLCWPAQKPRTKYYDRKPGRFAQDGRPVTRTKALQRIEAEVARLGGSYPLLSSDYQTKKDGSELSRAREPADPGVCLYFSLGGKPMAMACDTYDSNQQNIAAIAAHLEATRAIERHGAATAAEALQAFVALPQPKRPHEILGVSATASETEIKAAWRARIAAAHPDQGGSESAASEVNAARDAMLKDLRP